MGPMRILDIADYSLRFNYSQPKITVLARSGRKPLTLRFCLEIHSAI